jgi:intein/homing endonuclease
VLAWNAETGEISFYPVTDTIHHTDQTIVKLTIGDETLTTTLEHPFYVEGKGWVKAKDLQVGDAVRKADGSSS